MSPLRVGVWAAVVIAGPPLCVAVTDGDLTGGTAVARALIVVLACTVGAAFVLGIIADYDVEARKAEERYLAKALLEQLKAEAERAKAGKDTPGG